MPFNPAADYVTAGQDEAGYRSWATSDPSRAPAVAGFYAYLSQRGVAGTNNGITYAVTGPFPTT